MCRADLIVACRCTLATLQKEMKKGLAGLAECLLQALQTSGGAQPQRHTRDRMQGTLTALTDPAEQKTHQGGAS